MRIILNKTYYLYVQVRRCARLLASTRKAGEYIILKCGYTFSPQGMTRKLST